jgi:hypothetical protein
MTTSFIHKGYGSIACPLTLIRGKRSARAQQEAIEQERSNIQNQIRAIKNRVGYLSKHSPIIVIVIVVDIDYFLSI